MDDKCRHSGAAEPGSDLAESQFFAFTRWRGRPKLSDGKLFLERVVGRVDDANVFEANGRSNDQRHRPKIYGKLWPLRLGAIIHESSRSHQPDQNATDHSHEPNASCARGAMG